MNCPKCNALLDAGTKFCIRCGAKVQPSPSVADATTILSNAASQSASSNATTVLSEDVPTYAKQPDPNATTVLSEETPTYVKQPDPNATTVLSEEVPTYAKQPDPNATTVLSDEAPTYVKQPDPNATTVLSEEVPTYAKQPDPNATTVLSETTPTVPKNAPAQGARAQLRFASPNAPVAPAYPMRAQAPVVRKSSDNKMLLIIGIVVGVLVLVGLIAVLLAIFLHRCDECGDWFFGKAYEVFGYVLDKDCYNDIFGF